MSKTGTKEWASSTVNCVNGCEHDCRYCYARHNAVNRWKRIKAEDWATMVVRDLEVKKIRHKREGVVMFPSTHDITPSVLEPCMTVLGKLLDAGNRVLLVSKPHYECITAITNKFRRHRDHLRFRFTIGAISDDVLGYWEPGAPKFAERLECLKLAQFTGYKTSISAEPLLEPWNVYKLFHALKPYVNWEFWIGKLNKSAERVQIGARSGRTILFAVLAGQTDRKIWDIYEILKDQPLVRWKDSYREVIEKFTNRKRLP